MLWDVAIAMQLLLLLFPLDCASEFPDASGAIVSTVLSNAGNVIDITLDGSGNILYLLSSFNYGAVYRLLPNGSKQFIGSGFNFPWGITSDTVHNIAYVSDSSNYRICRADLSPTNAFTSLAGGSYGYSNGGGTNAQFGFPTGIVFHSSGVLYVTDRPYVRKIVVSNGLVSTIITLTTQYYPYLCINKDGSLLYVTDGSTIVRVPSDGSSSLTLAGTTTAGYRDGVGTDALFNLPRGITLNDDESTLFIVDRDNYRIRKLVLSTRMVTTVAGNGTVGFQNGPGLSASFASMDGLRWRCNRTSCGLLVADYDNLAVRFVTIESETESHSVGSLQRSLSTSRSRSDTASQPATRTLSASDHMSQSASSSPSRPPMSVTETRATTPSSSVSLSVSQTLRSSLTITNSISLSSSHTASRSVSFTALTRSATNSTSPTPSTALSRTHTVSPRSRTRSSSKTLTSPSTNSSSMSPSKTDQNCSVPLEVFFTLATTTLEGVNSIGQNSNSSHVTNLCVAPMLQHSTESQLSCLSPLLFASAKDNLTWNAEVSSLPLTPVRIVFGFALSASWRMESNSLNASALNTATQVIIVSESLPHVKMGYMSTVMSTPPAFDTKLFIRLVASCTTERMNISITVHWPAAPAVSTTTVVATTLASTAGAAFGGDVVSAASLVLLSMLSCNTLAPNPGVSGYVMSVFFDDGPVSMVTGNVGIGVFVLLCQFGFVAVVARLRSQSRIDAAVTLRFPAVSIRVTDFLLPGTMYSALTAFWSTENGAVATGVFGVMVVVVALVALEYFYAVRHVLPLCKYSKYNTTYPTGHWLETRFLFPTWQWSPREVRCRFWPMMGPYVPGSTWVRVVTMCLALLLAVVAAMASSGVGCIPGAWTVGILHILVAILLIIMKPFRMPSDALLCPLGTTIMGVACCLKASGNENAVGVSDDFTTAMALVQVVRTLVGLWVQWREGQWSEEDSLERLAEVGDDGLSDKIAEWDDGEEVPMSLLMSEHDDAEMRMMMPPPNSCNDSSSCCNDVELHLLAIDHTESVHHDGSHRESDPTTFSGIEGYFLRAPE